jgi:glycosyltransferase involved in cell wall biosynthesis
MNKLTVIIPFLNEGEEIGRTLQSIRETAGEQVDIILVNDASYNNFDYEPVAAKYNASYIRNEKRMGAAYSRDTGVQHCATDCFLHIDGHMRFYHNDWWKTIVAAIEQNKRALFCCKCKALDTRGTDVTKQPFFGASISFYDLSPVWNRRDICPDRDMATVPCVLGASYACNKQYWQYLKGLSGLKMYGSEEPYISLKVWLEGGECILLKKIEIGHIFRNRFPYLVSRREMLFNKLLIAETLLPPEHKDRVYNALRNTGGIFLRDAMRLLLDEDKEIKELKSYYQNISTRSFESFFEFNASVANSNNN